MILNNTFYLLVVILGFTSLIGPLGTYLKERKNKAYIFLAILGIITGPIWAISCVSFLLADSLEVAEFWSKIIYFASILIGLFHFIFSSLYLRKKKTDIIFTLFVFFGFFYLSYEVFFTSNFISKIIIEGSNYIEVGYVYLIWVLWLIVVFSTNIYKTLVGYKKLSFIEKEQQKYLLMGNILTVFGSFPANVIAPYFGIYEYIWVGPTIFSIANLIISYGLTQTKFQRLSIVVRVTLRALLLYLLPGILLVLSFEFIFPLLKNLPFSRLLLYLLAIIVLSIIFRLFEYLVSNVFLSEKQILKNKGEAFFELMNFEQELSVICTKTLKYICQNTPVNKAKVYLYDSVNRSSYNYTEGEWNIQGLSKLFTELPLYWKKENREKMFKPLLRSELEYLSRKEPMTYKELSGLLTLLKLSKIQVVYPIVSGNELIGVLFIHDLENDEMYRIDELNLWDRIYGQFHVSVNKALLYKQLQYLNNNLQQKVDEQTKELQTKVEELQEARRKESDMIDIMGHELRTPATIVKLNAGFLNKFVSEIKSDPVGYQKYVKRIQDSIENEIKLINTLLSSAKLEGDKIELNPEAIDIKQEIEMALHGNEGDAQIKNLQLINRTDPNTPKIYADKARTVEVLNNLINNAIKYTDKGGVGIATRYDDNFVTVTVADTGKGIPKESIPKLGQKFYRLNNYIKSSKGDKVDVIRPGGTGLGLYVTFNLIKKMGGNISVQSEVGNGSAFSFSLPRLKEQVAFVSEKSSSQDMFKRLGLAKK